MPQTCTVCRQVNIADIERAMIGGEPLRDMRDNSGSRRMLLGDTKRTTCRKRWCRREPTEGFSGRIA
jgi:hypothetical protein